MFLCFVWIILGWIVADFATWLFIQQIVETLTYNFYQICWALIAYIQRISCCVTAAKPESLKITSKSLRIKASVLAWFLIIFVSFWKFLIDGILPSIWTEFENFIGQGDEKRSLQQKLLWIFLLSAPMLAIELFALINYLMLKRLLTKNRCNQTTESQISAISDGFSSGASVGSISGSDSVFDTEIVDSAAKRSRICQTKSASATNKALKVMLLITLVEDATSLLWLITPFSPLQFMIATMAIAILNNFLITYVSVRNFGTAKEAIALMKREILKN